MSEQNPGEPKINPAGETGGEKTTKETAQELAHTAAHKTMEAARATKTSFINIFKIWAKLAPDPVSRTPQAVNEIGASDAWQSLAWVAVLYGVVLPFIEFNLQPMLFRHRHSILAYVFHAVALCVGMTASVYGSAKLFRGNTSLEKSAFAVSVSLIPQWITISLVGLFYDWTSTWIFGVIGFGSCVALFMLYSIFTHAFGLTDRRATLAVPLALGVGGGAAFYLGKIIS